MKYVWNVVKGIIIFAWAVIAVFTTVCLISYNDYKVSEFGKKSLLIMDSDELEPNYKENSLVIVTKEKADKYAVGDEVFYYLGNVTSESIINYGPISEIVKAEGAEDSYLVNDLRFSYSDLIGKGNTAVSYNGIGKVLYILESQWGYMFLVILPTLFAVVYEIYAIVVEVKRETKKEIKNEEE